MNIGKRFSYRGGWAPRPWLRRAKTQTNTQQSGCSSARGTELRLSARVSAQSNDSSFSEITPFRSCGSVWSPRPRPSAMTPTKGSQKNLRISTTNIRSGSQAKMVRSTGRINSKRSTPCSSSRSATESKVEATTLSDPTPTRWSGAEHSSFPEALLRPFVDLRPCERGPLCAQGIEQYWLAFTDTRRPRFVLQRTLPRRFRAQLLSELGLPQYQVEDPRDVPEALRSARWNSVCEALDHWPQLTTDQQCRLVLVFHALCFYSLISSLIPDMTEREITADPDCTELAYRRASARYVLGFPDRVADYGNADLSELERIVTTAPHDHPVALNGTLKVLVHKA